jgi:hypothetical protein
MLAVLIGGMLFIAGMGAGMRVVAVLLAHRERQLSRERRVINDVWRQLYRSIGVERSEWMADSRDRDHVEPVSGDGSGTGDQN